jgi:hypothetical protein
MAKKVDLLISGGGPGGLALAWYAAKEGKSVLVVTDRADDSIRVQRTILDQDSRAALLAMLPSVEPDQCSALDAAFIEELTQNLTVGIKDVERFIRRRIEELNLEAKKVDFQFEAELAAADLSRGHARLKALSAEGKLEEDQVEFTHLGGADGITHHAANILNESKELTVTYHPVLQLEHKYHVTCYLRMEKDDGSELTLPDKPYHLMLLTETDESKEEGGYIDILGFDQHSFEKLKHKAIKFNFVGELPKSLYDRIKAKHPQAEADALSYIRKAVAHYFEENGLSSAGMQIALAKKSQKHGPKKDALKLLAFETDLQEASAAGHEIKGHYFLLLGDALRGAHYLFATGLNASLKQARWAGLVVNQGLDINGYNKLCGELSRSTSDDVRLFSSRKKSEIVSMLNKDLETSYAEFKAQLHR